MRDYLAVDYRARPVALFQESLLAPMPEMDTDQAERLCRIQALARPLDRRFLADFLIDLSWASSLLEDRPIRAWIRRRSCSTESEIRRSQLKMLCWL